MAISNRSRKLGAEIYNSDLLPVMQETRRCNPGASAKFYAISQAHSFGADNVLASDGKPYTYANLLFFFREYGDLIK
ncbi:hypothetical protein UFOVP1299_75 [uncultured Caudovirales phage]|uniref:Uncharacterized protein n=1 Tax=uncultured Caudovirales phage TaxID=2100421 RepID=A0A6J5RRZ8_9CAUD|nr:hypothetical protein UFOVP1299_75 [uncultured Caudovirales phage]